MDCREAQRFVQLRLDDEIEPVDCAGLEDHLQSCEHCRARVRTEDRIQSAIRSKLRASQETEDSKPPPGLEGRILRELEHARREKRFPYVRYAAAASVVFILGAFTWGATSSTEEVVLEETIARHGRNLPPEVRLLSDTAEVDRFLRRNLHYRVPLPKFHQPSPVRLVGARLSSVRDRDVAYLMYKHRGARVSVFAYPVSAQFASPAGFRSHQAGARTFYVGKRRGYNVVSWRERDIFYSMVSDVDPSQLVRFVSE